MTDQQIPLVRLVATKDRCQRQIRLDKAGKPVMCNRVGYARLEVEGSIPLCRDHFQETQVVVNQYYKSSQSSRRSDEEETKDV